MDNGQWWKRHWCRDVVCLMSSTLRPWQDACENALRGVTNGDALKYWGHGHSRNGALVPPFDYRFEHTLAVVKLGKWLAPQVSADADVLICAAWLHDCKKRYGTKENDSHALDAAEALDEILGGTDFPPQKIPAVRHAILNHVGLSLSVPLEPLETACLWDIDKLSKLGAASLVHYIAIGPAFQPYTTVEVLKRGEAWLELAIGTVSSMNTEPAKAEAKARFEFLQDFYRRLRDEC
jgi:uncharacterized protein